MRGQINKQQWVSMIILAAIGRRFSGMRMMSWPICRWFPVAIGNGGFAVAIFVIWRICQFLETLNIYHKSYIYWQLWLNHQPCVCWSNPKKAQAAEYIWVPFFLIHTHVIPYTWNIFNFVLYFWWYPIKSGGFKKTNRSFSFIDLTLSSHTHPSFVYPYIYIDPYSMLYNIYIYNIIIYI